MSQFYNLSMDSIEGQAVSFDQYKDTTCLIVNVASRWGLTPQYAGLRTLHNDHADKGFAVLAFPCNQFGAQEPGSDAEVLEFATSKYDVNFPMFSKIEVNGDGACELYKWLKTSAPEADGKEDIPWNFTKFLVSKSGEVIARIGPQTTPEEIAAMLPEHL